MVFIFKFSFSKVSGQFGAGTGGTGHWVYYGVVQLHSSALGSNFLIFACHNHHCSWYPHGSNFAGSKFEVSIPLYRTHLYTFVIFIIYIPTTGRAGNESMVSMEYIFK